MRPLVSALCLLVALPAAAQKIYLDRDENYDFTTVETYDFFDTESTSVARKAPLLHSRILESIEQRLTNGGLTKSSSPDVLVTYHGSVEEKVEIDTTHHGYDYPSSWRWGAGYGRYGHPFPHESSTTVRTYEVGTLVIDVWDAESKKLVWRGTADGIMVTKDSEKMAKRIDKAIQKMVKKAQKQRKKRNG